MEDTRVSLSKIKGEIDQLDIDKANKTAVLNLIDMKIDTDMKEVLNRMDMLFGKFDVQLGKFDVQLQGLKSEFKTENQSLKNELKTENQSLRSELKNETKMIYWVIGIAMAVITVIVTIIGLMITFKK